MGREPTCRDSGEEQYEIRFPIEIEKLRGRFIRLQPAGLGLAWLVKEAGTQRRRRAVKVVGA